MVHLDASLAEQEESGDKGLKEGALGFVSSVVVGVASTAPAYSLAATLGFVVIAINGLQAPIITIIAFVPMLFISYGYKALNSADPDCGTTFTWGARAFGPKTGWWGGWGIVAADILVMASLAQIAGQYVFLLFGANGIGQNPNSGWVLLVGVHVDRGHDRHLLRGHRDLGQLPEGAARHRDHHAAGAVGGGAVQGRGRHGPGRATSPPPGPGSTPSPYPTRRASWSASPSCCSSTGAGTPRCRSTRRPRSATRSRAGPPSPPRSSSSPPTPSSSSPRSPTPASARTGIGLENPNHAGDVLSVLGTSIFGTSGFGSFLTKLLLLMVLSSAAASTQTTILPTARTTLSMAVFKAIPNAFSKIHKRFLTPTVSTLAMGGVSIVLYVVHELRVQRQRRDRGLGLGPRRLDRLLLRAHRPVAASGTTAARWARAPKPLAARHPAPGRVGDAVVRHVLGVLVLLAPHQLLHVLDHAGHPLGGRRRVPARRRHRPPRDHPHGRLRPDAPGLLPGRGPQPRHPDPGAPGHRYAGRPVRDRAATRTRDEQPDRAEAGVAAARRRCPSGRRRCSIRPCDGRDAARQTEVEVP